MNINPSKTTIVLTKIFDDKHDPELTFREKFANYATSRECKVSFMFNTGDTSWLSNYEPFYLSIDNEIVTGMSKSFANTWSPTVKARFGNNNGEHEFRLVDSSNRKLSFGYQKGPCYLTVRLEFMSEHPSRTTRT
uniref:Uncharacterized protein n=1 Tax=viral metagenome TaxID=1070528 RepID=A0A6C0EKJ7_9ZZZZ